MDPGLYLTHKPVGATSFSLVQTFLEETGRRVPLCHGGTLDPFAEGLLLMLVGPATKLMDLIHAVPKTYVAEIAWGKETDNGDLLGRTVLEGDPSALRPEQLDEALSPFFGWQDQVPPATSAKKIDGEPAYKKAHRGEAVVLPPSRVYLHAARWRSHALPQKSVLELTCRGGYYVRALARDLGRALGCGAHLSGLSRTSIGPWSDPGLNARSWIHGEGLLPWCAARVLSDEEARAFKEGATLVRGHLRPPSWKLPAGFPDPDGPVRALHQGRLMGLLEERGGRWRVNTILQGR